jgi:hypothetical protein
MVEYFAAIIAPLINSPTNPFKFAFDSLSITISGAELEIF